VVGWVGGVGGAVMRRPILWLPGDWRVWGLAVASMGELRLRRVGVQV
jgi:hypothetical protein